MDSQIKDDFAALGATIEVAEEEPEEENMPIAPENWTSLMAFMGCETQWRVTSTMAGLIWIGLDYVGVKVLLDAEDLDRDVFRDIRIMEAAALPILNEAD